MKKRILIIALVAVLAFSVVAMAACDNGDGFTHAYAVYSDDAVIQASVKIVDGKIVDAMLDEARFPHKLTGANMAVPEAERTENEYVVLVGTNYFYKTVKWADVTATHDGTAYMIDGKTIVEWMSDEANGEARCEAYFEAVAANQITVVTASGEKTDRITAFTALKSLNNYWPAPHASAPTGWAQNVRQMRAFVIKYGVDFTTSSFTQNDSKVWQVVSGGATYVVVGCTWSGFAAYFNALKAAAAK